MDEPKYDALDCGGVYQRSHLWQFIKEFDGQIQIENGWVAWTRRHYSYQHCRKYDVIDTKHVHMRDSSIIEGR